MKSFLPRWLARLFADTTSRVQELRETLDEARKLNEQAKAYLDGEDDWWKRTDVDRDSCGIKRTD
jgi:hypothetical protein